MQTNVLAAWSILLSVGTMQVQAQSVQWLMPVDGLWDAPKNWVGGQVPDTLAETAVLGLDMPYTVTVANTNPTLGGLEVSNASAIIEITNALGFRYLYVNSSVINNGLIRIVDSGASSDAFLWTQSDTIFDGTGVIELAVEEGSNLGDAQLYAGFSSVLTIGSQQTVQGTGQIGGQGTIVNDGTIDPNASSAMLQLTGNHGQSTGIYRASQGMLDLYTASLTGVTFDSSESGRIGAFGGNPVLEDVSNVGSLEVSNNLGFRTMNINGTILNNGQIRILDEGSSADASLWSQTSTLISGTGEIELSVEDGSNLADAQLYAGFETSLTIGPDQTVHGTGQIGGQGTIINHGIVDPRAKSANLQLTGVHTQGTGVYTATDGKLDLYTATMTGVTFDASDGGRVGAFGGNPVLTDVINVGVLEVSNSLGFRTLNINNTLVNNGVIRVLDDGSSADASLWSQSDTTISGSGVIDMVVEESSNLADAQIYPAFETTLTIGSEQTVQGSGQIGGQGIIINNGTIDPASSMAMLQLTGSHGQGTGVYTASEGTLDLYTANMSAVTFVSSGSGRVGAYRGDPILADVINEGTLEVSNGFGFRSMNITNTLMNNGVIRVLDDGSSANASLWSQTDSTISGSGVVELIVEDGSSLTDAQLYAAFDTTLTIGPDQTISGSGQIAGQGTIINNGTLAPSGNQRELEVIVPVTNSTTANLSFDIGGTEPGEHDVITLNSSMEMAGTINIAFDEGYIPVFGDRWTLIDGGTQSGAFQQLVVSDPPLGQVFRVFTNPSETFVILTCDADLSGDGGIDFFDVSFFLGYFGAQDVRGDLNGDGQFNFFDISTFLQVFGQGCDL